MRVHLSNELFENDHAQLPVLGMFALAWDARHVLLTNPPYHLDGSGVVHRWLKSLNSRMAASVRHVLNTSVVRSAHQTADCATVSINIRRHSDWERGLLTPNDGLALLTCPLRLLLEDQTSDYHFLRCLARPTIRKQLDQAVASGWIEVQHGGGIEQIYKRVLDSVTSPKLTPTQWCWRLRLWIMFDRDALPTDATKPSKVATKLRHACNTVTQPWPLGHFQLERRAIENYLSKKQLYRWANGASGNTRPQRRKLVEQFFRLTTEQRRCFPMKDGFKGKSPANLPPPFDNLDARLAAHLSSGFGRHLAAMWMPVKSHHDDGFQAICDEDGLNRDAVLSTLMRFL